MGALLGDEDVGPGFPALGGGSRGDAVLAGAPVCADHLLAEVSHGADDGAGGDRLSGEARRTRAAERDGGGAAQRERELWAAISGGVHAGWIAVAGVAQGVGGERKDERAGVSRRGAAGECDSD